LWRTREEVSDIEFIPIHSSFFGDWTGTLVAVRARPASHPFLRALWLGLPPGDGQLGFPLVKELTEGTCH
jgi:hypothetical protein